VTAVLISICNCKCQGCVCNRLLSTAVCCCSIELNMDLPQAQSTTIGSASQASQQQVHIECIQLFALQ